jgi:hypothetical protein
MRTRWVQTVSIFVEYQSLVSKKFGKVSICLEVPCCYFIFVGKKHTSRHISKQACPQKMFINIVYPVMKWTFGVWYTFQRIVDFVHNRQNLFVVTDKNVALKIRLIHCPYFVDIVLGLPYLFVFNLDCILWGVKCAGLNVRHLLVDCKGINSLVVVLLELLSARTEICFNLFASYVLFESLELLPHYYKI